MKSGDQLPERFWPIGISTTLDPMPVTTGLPVLCDLGEARVGNNAHSGDIMPGIYRAPEVILDLEWDCKVDIWSIGTTVS